MLPPAFQPLLSHGDLNFGSHVPPAFQPVCGTGFPAGVWCDPEGSPASPGVGQHGREILGELGFDAAMVEGLVRDGAVTLPD